MSLFSSRLPVAVRSPLVLFLGLWGLLATTFPAAAQTPTTIQVPLPATSSGADWEAATDDTLPDDALRPYRYGVVLPTETGLTDGAWTRIRTRSGDTARWRVRLVSSDAYSVSLRLSSLSLPNGATLTVSNPSRTVRHGPYTRNDVRRGTLWTPLVPGPELVVTLDVPAPHRDAVSLRIDRLIHADRPLPALDGSEVVSAKAGTCNVDIACPDADPWRDASKSVASYSYVEGSRSYVCTGALVNNTAADGRQLFLTAEHCVHTEAQATSMVFYWNYEHPTCRSLGSSANGSVTSDSRLDQTSAGATLLMSYGNEASTGNITGKPDLSLVEIVPDIPADYNVFYSGWDRTGTAPPRSASIHHPQGDGKRIAIDDDPATITDFAQSFARADGTHFRIAAWDDGTTEQGSSGSPLLDPNGRIVGVLSGGAAGCPSFGSINDNDRPDWYGRLALGWDGGGTDATRLAPWLDPVDSGVTTLDGAYPDVLPVELAAFEGTGGEGSLDLSWTTASETNNAGFYTEIALLDDPTRSDPDALAFRRIGTFIEGHGTTSRARRYSTTLRPVTPNRYVLRLVQVDFDNTRTVVGETDVEVRPAPLSVDPPAPNPSRTAPSITITADRTQTVTFTFYDALGRRVRTFSETLVIGIERTVQLNTQGLPSGRYFVRIQGDTFQQTESITVVR